MTMIEQKAEARRLAFIRRKSAHVEHREAAAVALVDHVASAADRIVAAYLPIRTEADPLPAMAALVKRNRVCVPVIESAGRPLRFREWHPDCTLEEGPFRVMVPSEGEWLVPDLVVVPLLAYDDCLMRLGYGGGFYDRTLEELRAGAGVDALGFAYSDQAVPVLPTEATDAPLDAIVTELGLRKAP